jgi:hypothetical protein
VLRPPQGRRLEDLGAQFTEANFVKHRSLSHPQQRRGFECGFGAPLVRPAIQRTRERLGLSELCVAEFFVIQVVH